MKEIEDQLFLDSGSEYEPESSGSSDEFDNNEEEDNDYHQQIPIQPSTSTCSKQGQ